MTIKPNKIMNEWALPNSPEETKQVTLRLDFDTYAKFHALKAVYPHKSVNHFMNTVLKAGVDEIIDAFGDPEGSKTEYIEEAGGVVDLSPNNAYLFQSAYEIILRDGSSSELLSTIHETEASK